MATNSRERSADSIDTASGGLIDELKAVRDSVEELYILLDHVWRNRQELYDILQNLAERHEEDREQERVVCCQCHAGAASLRVAVHNGWTSFQRDDEGEEWAYLGVCGSCQKSKSGGATGSFGGSDHGIVGRKKKGSSANKIAGQDRSKIGDDASD